MRNVAELYAIIKGDASPMEREFRRANGVVSSFRDATQRAGSGVQDFFRQMSATASGVLAARLFQQITAQIKNIGAQAIQSTGQLQAMQVGLEGLLAREIAAAKGYSSIGMAMDEARVQAAELMEELEEIALISPYQVETIQSTYKTAMAFGYTAREAIDYTSALLNVASGVGATNEQMGRMAYNLAQVRMVGSITARDLRELAMAGFDLNSVLRYIGQSMGIAIEDHNDFNKALEMGLITWEDFTAGFAAYAESNFGGAAKRMSTTLLGLKSTFADVFTLTMPKIIGGAVQAVTDRLNRVLDLFMDLRESGILEEWGARVSRAFEGVMAPIDAFLDRLDAYREAMAEIKQATLPDQAMAAFADARELSGGFGFAGVVTLGLLGPDRGARVLQVLEWIKGHLEEIKAGALGIAGAFAGLKVLSIAANLGLALTSPLAPITALVVGIGMLAAAWQRDWGGMRTAVLGFWEETGRPAMEGLRDRVTEVAVQVGQYMLPVFERAREVGTRVWNDIRAAVEPLAQDALAFLVTQFEKVKAWVEENLPLIRDTWLAVINRIETVWAGLWPNLQTALAIGWESIKNTIDAALDILLLGFEAVMLVITGDWDGAWEKVQDIAVRVWDWLVPFVVGKGEMLASLFGTTLAGVWAAVSGFFAGLWTSITTWVTQAAGAVGAWFAGVGQSIRDFFVNTWQAIVDWATRVAEKIEGFADGVCLVFETLFSLAGSLIVAGFDLILGFWGTSTDELVAFVVGKWEEFKANWALVWGWIAEVVPPIWETIKGGVETAVGAVVLVVTTAVEGLKVAWDGAWAWMSETLGPVWETINAAVATAWGTLSETVTGVIDSIKLAWDGLWSGMTESFAPAWETISSAITTAWETIQEAVSSISEGLKTIWENLRTPHFTVEWQDTILGRIPKAVKVDWYAQGLDEVFTKPTLIGVGESGAERVQVTPMGGGTKGGMPPINITINAPGGEPATVAGAARGGVLQAMRELGELV